MVRFNCRSTNSNADRAEMPETEIVTGVSVAMLGVVQRLLVQQDGYLEL